MTPKNRGLSYCAALLVLMGNPTANAATGTVKRMG